MSPSSNQEPTSHHTLYFLAIIVLFYAAFRWFDFLEKHQPPPPPPVTVEYVFSMSYVYKNAINIADGNTLPLGFGRIEISTCGRMLQDSDLTIAMMRALESFAARGIHIPENDLVPLATIPIGQKTVASCTP